MKYSVCLLAAGKGSRTHLDYNKVFYPLADGQTVLEHSVQLFLSDPECRQVIVTAADYEKDLMTAMLAGKDERIRIVPGGKTRQESVYNALQQVQEAVVMIHDGARPYLGQRQVQALKEAMETEQAALLMVPCTDTIKQVDENGYIVQTLPRQTLYAAQTPQVFSTSLIRRVHEKARQQKAEATDDAQLVELFSSVPVRVVEGDPSNTKITTPADLAGNAK